MVFTAAQTASFFQDADQMAILNATVVQLQMEGIMNVNDLGEFDKDNLSQVATNLHRPPGGVAALTFRVKFAKETFGGSKSGAFLCNHWT